MFLFLKLDAARSNSLPHLPVMVMSTSFVFCVIFLVVVFGASPDLISVVKVLGRPSQEVRIKGEKGVQFVGPTKLCLRGQDEGLVLGHYRRTVPLREGLA